MNGEIRPFRALLHPAFLASVALLALNDHFLKGSSILPGVITGKLSDFAGLFAAPPLLAALFFVRTRRGLAIAHAATAIGFTALQLVPAIGVAIETATTQTGLPMRIWPDPTDLIALPIQAVSFWALLPSMRRTADTRRAAHTLAGIAAFVVCTATSYQPPEYPRTGSRFEAQVFLHNASHELLYVNLARPAADAEFSCDEALANPAAVFDRLDGSHRYSAYTLQPNQNMPVLIGEPEPNRPCQLVVVNEHAVAWPTGGLPTLRLSYEGRIDVPGALTSDGERIYAGRGVVVRRR